MHNPSLRNTGSFRAVGRILAHSFLHGGPGIHGLSKAAVKHYFASEKKQDLSSDPPPLGLQDLPDFDLRMLLKEVRTGSTVFPKNCSKLRHERKPPKLGHLILKVEE